MKQIIKVAALIVLLSFCFFGSSSLADSKGIIKYRQNVMKVDRWAHGSNCGYFEERFASASPHS